jgi:hypothetical protein
LYFFETLDQNAEAMEKNIENAFFKQISDLYFEPCLLFCLLSYQKRCTLIYMGISITATRFSF